MKNMFTSVKESLILKKIRILFVFIALVMFAHVLVAAQTVSAKANELTRECVSIGKGWKFFKYNAPEQADNLIYDVRPEIITERDDKPADSRPTEGIKVAANKMVLKPWILPSGNKFIKDTLKWFRRPEGNPGSDFPFTQNDFDDNSWEGINIPHDWAIKGPFLKGMMPWLVAAWAGYRCMV